MKHLATVLIAATLLTGCGAPSSGSSDSPTPETIPSSAATAAMPRGLDATVIPTFVESPEARLAVEFVRAAATPDSRLDGSPSDAVQRARPLMTPALAQKTTTGQELVSSDWWSQDFMRNDGWISIEFTNVLGDTHQAAPDPNAPSPTHTSEGLEVEVMFHRIIHSGGASTKLNTVTVWTVTIADGQVSAFAESA